MLSGNNDKENSNQNAHMQNTYSCYNLWDFLLGDLNSIQSLQTAKTTKES